MPSKIFFVLFSCFLSIVQYNLHAQAKQGKDYIRLMFYNVENFFDTENDPTVNDNDFTPDGSMHWTKSRYITKRNSIFRVIANVGEWEPPALIGLCETENRSVFLN